MTKHTQITIEGESFLINGELTYKGREWNGKRIEGLLLNSRMVQGIFDDLNPKTAHQWAYPDTGRWDANRNTDEFIAAMPAWKDHGLLAFTINLQGGSPYGYSKQQPWINSAIMSDGSLNRSYIARLERIIDQADKLGIVVILGIFYFGQEKILADESAIKQAVSNTVNWLFDKGYTNVIIEINNECDVSAYQQPILMPDRVHELIQQVKDHRRDAQRFLVGTSYKGGSIPKANVVKVSDFLLLHGNGVSDPNVIAEMVRQTRELDDYRPMPILFNEDDHFDFDKPSNNFVAAINEYASWGYFDYRLQDEGYEQGYQSIPVNWGVSSERKQAFFTLAKNITMED